MGTKRFRIFRLTEDIKMKTTTDIRKMISKIPHPKALHFWTGDGETYYAEWNSIRKGYPEGCVDIRIMGSHKDYLFYLTEDTITPAFNWKDGTSSLQVVEAYLENCQDSIFKTVSFFHEMSKVSKAIMLT